MIYIKSTEQYWFQVEEKPDFRETFTVLHPKSKSITQVFEEAARLFYYGRAGWLESWPLTFRVETLTNKVVGRASIFVCSALPTFDVIVLR